VDKRKKHGTRRHIKLVTITGTEAAGLAAHLELEHPAAGAAKSNGAAVGAAELVADGLQQVSSTAAELTAEQLTAQADAIATEYTPAPSTDESQNATLDPQAPPQVSTEDAEKGYRMIGLAVVGQSALIFAPAWHVTLEEQTTVSDAIVQALMIWFPGGLIPAKYLALLVLASAVGAIAIARIDPVTGELPPRHAPAKKSVPVPQQPPAAAGAAATHIQPPH
jgi:hypothetical protein